MENLSFKKFRHYVRDVDSYENLWYTIYSSTKHTRIEEVKIMDLQKQPGIYAFLDGDEVVYIGLSCRPIEVRIQEHYNTDIEYIKKKIAAGGIYERSLDFHEELRARQLPIQVLYTAEPHDTRLSLEVAERFFINWFKPKYNSAGVICPYYYSEEDEHINWKAIEEYQKGCCSWPTAKKRVIEREKLKGEF